MKARARTGKRPVIGGTPEFVFFTDEQVKKIMKTVGDLPGPNYAGAPKAPDRFYLLRDKDFFERCYSLDDERAELVPLEIVLECILQGSSRKYRLPTDVERKGPLTRSLERIDAIIADAYHGLVSAEIISPLKQAAYIVTRDLTRCEGAWAGT
jgi:hypothetical protein